MITDRPGPLEAARSLVEAWYPVARQVWLTGSVVTGGATATPDLDLVVLTDDTTAHRRTLVHDGWLAEVFVHTASSVADFVARDLARRRPSLARMISSGVPLVAGDAGREVRERCAAALAAGPPPLSEDELRYHRYALTDQLDDLVGGAAPPVLDAIAIDVWRRSAELLLDVSGRWQGTGKWLVREVQQLDAERGTAYADLLHSGLHAALDGDPGPLICVADEILTAVGGRLSEGYVAGG